MKNLNDEKKDGLFWTVYWIALIVFYAWLFFFDGQEYSELATWRILIRVGLSILAISMTLYNVIRAAVASALRAYRRDTL